MNQSTIVATTNSSKEIVKPTSLFLGKFGDDACRYRSPRALSVSCLHLGLAM